MNGNVIRTITIRGTSEGLDKLQADLVKVAAGYKDVTVATEETNKTTLSLEQSLKRQALRLDEVARSQNNIAREKKIADAALREGLIDQQRHAELLNLANQRYTTIAASTQKVAQQTGLARHELINLGRQAQDVGVSLVSGQSPLMVLAQQGSQIADVFISSGKSIGSFFSQAIGWAGRFAMSAAGVATGIGAIAASALYAASSWADGQREIDRALIGIGRRAGATRGQINEMAEANAAAAKLSVSEWASAAAQFAATGNIGRENFKGLADLVKGFAAATGESVSEATQHLAKMFSGDVQQVAAGLNAIFGNISGTTIEMARNLEVAGQRQQALSVLIRAATADIQNATQVTGFWAASWNGVANAASNAAGAVGRSLAAITGIGDTLEGQLGRYQAALQRIQDAAAAGRISAEAAAGATANLRQKIDEVQASLAKVQHTPGLEKIGNDADEAVKKLLPHIAQLKEIEALQNAIRKGAGAGGLGMYAGEAIEAGERQKQRIMEQANEATREYTYATEASTNAVENNTEATGAATYSLHLLQSQTEGLSGAMITWREIFSQWGDIATEVANRLSMLNAQFEGKQYESTYDPLNLQQQRQSAEATARALGGTVEEVTHGVGTGQFTSYRVRLNDTIVANTAATNANTAATQTMTDVLSPFYSSDPRNTYLGFRAFAGGGIMTAQGPLPLKQYQGGGIASSPQIAVYGENSTAEAFVPVPTGKIPVEIKQPANSNRPVNVTINISGNADASTVAALKSTAFQQAQTMRRALR